MARVYSAKFLLSILDGIEDGITVLSTNEDGLPEIIFENAQAAAFRAAGAAACCVKILEKSLLTVVRTSVHGTGNAKSAGVHLPAGQEASPSGLTLQVHSNPVTSVLVKTVFEAIPEVCFLGDSSTGGILFTNQPWQKFSTTDPSDTLASWERLLHPDDREATAAAWIESATSFKPYEKEYRLMKCEGGNPNDAVWIKARARHVLNSYGRSVVVAGILMDQTEIVHSRHLAAREKTFMCTALDAVPVGVAIARKGDERDSVVFVNKEIEHIWRNDAIQLRDVHGYGDYVAYKQDGSRVQAHEWPLVRSLTTGEVVQEEDYSFERFDGTNGVIRYSSSPVLDPATAVIIGSVAVVLDVTEKISAEKEKAARFAAEQAAAQMRQMVANVSHEIRTPIAGVIGLAALLEDSPLDEDQRELIGGIRDSGQLLLCVINDLLDHSKIAAGKMELEKKPFNLHSMIKHTLLMTGEVAKAKELQLITRFDQSLPAAIVGSELRFKQVLLNLLSNAAKFTPPGGTITLEGRAEVLVESKTPITQVSAASTGVVEKEAGSNPCSVVASVVSTTASNSLLEDETVGAIGLVEVMPGSSLCQEPLTQRTTCPAPSACYGVGASAALAFDMHDDAVLPQQEEDKKASASAEDTSSSSGSTSNGCLRDASCEHQGPSVMLHFSLRDTGIGLTKDQMSRLFRPFMQADNSTTRQYGGTGLGLVLCRDILELMGGSIRVESEGEGKGACFHLSFLAEMTSELPAEAGSSSSGSNRLLLSTPSRSEAHAISTPRGSWSFSADALALLPVKGPAPIAAAQLQQQPKPRPTIVTEPPSAHAYSSTSVRLGSMIRPTSPRTLGAAIGLAQAGDVFGSLTSGGASKGRDRRGTSFHDDSRPPAASDHTKTYSPPVSLLRAATTLPPIMALGKATLGAADHIASSAPATPQGSTAAPSPRSRFLPPLEKPEIGGFAVGVGSSTTALPIPTKTPRILVVDDVAVNRSVARRYLQKLGYTDICLACDGSEAVKMVAEDVQGFDVVLCDLMMPVMGGAEAATAIKALPIPNPPPVVAVSAATSERERLCDLFFDWLPKPFTTKELGDMVEKCLA